MNRQRPGGVCNCTKAEYRSARLVLGEGEKGEDVFVISVREHKTPGGEGSSTADVDIRWSTKVGDVCQYHQVRAGPWPLTGPTFDHVWSKATHQCACTHKRAWPKIWFSRSIIYQSVQDRLNHCKTIVWWKRRYTDIPETFAFNSHANSPLWEHCGASPCRKCLPHYGGIAWEEKRRTGTRR